LRGYAQDSSRKDIAAELGIEEVARRQMAISKVLLPQIGDRKLTIEAEVDTSGIAGLIIYIEGFINTAESRAQARSKLPDKFEHFPWILLKLFQSLALKILNTLFKDQREVNFNILTALRQSLELNKQLLAQVQTLRSQAEQNLQYLYQSLQDLSGYARGIDENLGNTTNQLYSVGQNLERTTAQLYSVGQNLESTTAQIQTVEKRLEKQREDSSNQVQSLETQVKESDERNFQDNNYLKNDLIQQKRLITMFLEEAYKRLPEPFNQEQLQSFSRELEHSLDAFYVSFEERFRGSRELIHKRLKVYLPLLKESQIEPSDSLIVDLACGRGEWLELLRENGYKAIGVDLNKVVIEQCQTRGLDVIQGDIIDYLKSVPDGSVAVVTGFHIIEHLPFETLIKLLDETLRVLRHGGLAIFETPNPSNVLVGSCYFYTDPTHRNPLPSSMTQFLAEYSGFSQVRVLNLNPSIETPVEDNSELAKRFNGYFYGPLDYAILGRKLLG
jgi:O-antigen chain-terminating methyltransferase